MTEIGSQRPEAGQRDGAESVAAALAPLARLDDTPVAGHVGIFEEVLTGLEAVLASVEEASAPASAEPSAREGAGADGRRETG